MVSNQREWWWKTIKYGLGLSKLNSCKFVLLLVFIIADKLFVSYSTAILILFFGRLISWRPCVMWWHTWEDSFLGVDRKSFGVKVLLCNDFYWEALRLLCFFPLDWHNFQSRSSLQSNEVFPGTINESNWEYHQNHFRHIEKEETGVVAR